MPYKKQLIPLAGAPDLFEGVPAQVYESILQGLGENAPAIRDVQLKRLCNS
jgi:hypothetical protein